MTAEFEGIAETLLVILAVTCIVQVIFTGLLLWYVRRLGETLRDARAPAPESAPREPAAVPRPLPSVPEKEEAGPAQPLDARPVEILEGSTDIQGSIQRLCEKYSLSDIIITTMDGLVVVSRYPGSSEEAARFSDLYRRRRKPDSPGVTFLEIAHRGEAMLAILKSDRPLTAGESKEIGEDSRKILNWWL